jgi:hypothetical protein
LQALAWFIEQVNAPIGLRSLGYSSSDIPADGNDSRSSRLARSTPSTRPVYSKDALKGV